MSQHLIVRKALGFISVDVLTTDADGIAVTPDANPSALIYYVDPDTGNLNPDLAMGVTGVLALDTNVASATGWYGSGLALAPAAYEQYVLLVTYVISAVTFSKRIDLQIAEEFATIINASVSTPTSVAISHKGP